MPPRDPQESEPALLSEEKKKEGSAEAAGEVPDVKVVPSAASQGQDQGGSQVRHSESSSDQIALERISRRRTRVRD